MSLEEVFKAKPGCKKGPHKVVATGGAGCGKSVCFTRKAPYEWAFGRLWKQFALLFCLELRQKSVWMAKTLADLLGLAALGLSRGEQEEVRKFITNHPDKVAIVCDGLDEGTVVESSFFVEPSPGKQHRYSVKPASRRDNTPMHRSRRPITEHQLPRSGGRRLHEGKCRVVRSQVPRQGRKPKAAVASGQAAVHCQHDACSPVLFARL